MTFYDAIKFSLQIIVKFDTNAVQKDKVDGVKES